MWEQASRVAAVINGTSGTGSPTLDGHPDRCPRCRCGDCGGRLDQHTDATCGCDSCQLNPSLACSLSEFLPDERIGFIAEQLGPLLSVHLGPERQRRCLVVAHAAHHALHDYDHPEESR
jgi:hypothetical protein